MIIRANILFIAPLFFLISCSPSFETGNRLYKEGYYREAATNLQEFVNNNNSDPIAHFTLADALYLKYSDDYSKKRANTNDLNLSMLHFSRAIELNPNYAEAYSQRGVVALVLGDVTRAKRDYDRAISLKPNLDRVYYNRGYWFEQQAEYSNSIADYKKYISLSNNNQWRDDAQKRIEILEMKIKLNDKKKR